MPSTRACVMPPRSTPRCDWASITRCGPLAWANNVGLAQVSTVLGHLAQTYGEDRYRTSPLIQHHVFAAKDFS